MLVGVLFHRGLYHHQPPSSVLGDITPYQCLFGSPPDYENIILFCYAYIPAQLRQKLAPRANRCFLKGHASAQKGFRCFDPSSRFRRPGMLPSMSTSSSTPTFFSRRLLDQHLLDLLHQWFFLRLPCIRGSQSPKGIRVAALYWAASTCTSLF